MRYKTFLNEELLSDFSNPQREFAPFDFFIFLLLGWVALFSFKVHMMSGQNDSCHILPYAKWSVELSPLTIKGKDENKKNRAKMENQPFIFPSAKHRRIKFGFGGHQTPPRCEGGGGVL